MGDRFTTDLGCPPGGGCPCSDLLCGHTSLDKGASQFFQLFDGPHRHPNTQPHFSFVQFQQMSDNTECLAAAGMYREARRVATVVQQMRCMPALSPPKLGHQCALALECFGITAKGSGFCKQLPWQDALHLSAFSEERAAEPAEAHTRLTSLSLPAANQSQ
jgi:hypothetical protein